MDDNGSSPGGLLSTDVEELAKALQSAAGSYFIADRVDDSDPKLKSALVSLVEDRYKESHALMWGYRKKWSLNDEFFLDNQQASWNPNDNTIVREPKFRQPVAPRTQFNIFKPIIMTAVARFQATHPQILIKAGSADQEAIDSARVAQRIVGQYEWHRQDMDGVLAEATPQLMLHGTAILKTEWNPKGGKALGKKPQYELDDNGQPIQDEDLVVDAETGALTSKPAVEQDGMTPRFKFQQDENGEPVLVDSWEGQIETSVVNSTDFLVDPTVCNFKDATWCIHASPRSPAWVYDRYSVSVQPDSQTNETEYRQGRINFGRTKDVRPKTVLVKELWIKPGTYKFGNEQGQDFTFPRGYVVIIAGGQLLSHGPNPYDHLQFPFVFIPALRVPRELWGDTIANSLRISQVTVNKTAAQIQQANDLCANPQWLLPADVKMPEVDRQSTPGLHKRFEPQPHGQVPTLLPGQSVAPAVFRYLEWALSITQTIAGQHEGGLAGGVPANVEAGVALEAIAERDTSRLATTAMEIGRGIKQWAWLTMRLWQQFKKVEETVTVTGRFMETEAISFSGSKILDSFDIIVVPESVIPSSRAAKFQKAMTLFQLQVLSPRDFRRRIGEDTPDEMSRDQLEIGNARDENHQALLEGFITTTDEMMAIEDHGLHAEEHDVALLSKEFRANPAAYAVLSAHNAKHKGALAMMASMQQGGPAPGAKPGPGGAAGPMPAAPSEPGEPNLQVSTAPERPSVGGPSA